MFSKKDIKQTSWSPGCSSKTSKFMVSFASLGGVPVLRRPSIRSCFSKNFSKPEAFFSSILPPSLLLFPIKIAPFKNVPVVSTNALALYFLFLPTAAKISPFFSSKSIISSSNTSICSFSSFA